MLSGEVASVVVHASPGVGGARAVVWEPTLPSLALLPRGYLPGYVGRPASGMTHAALCGGVCSAGFEVKRGTSLAGGMGWADVTL